MKPLESPDFTSIHTDDTPVVTVHYYDKPAANTAGKPATPSNSVSYTAEELNKQAPSNYFLEMVASSVGLLLQD